MSSGFAKQGRFGQKGDLGRLLIGTVLIVLVGYLGIVLAPILGVANFWPHAGIWAAIGWGASKISMKPVIALVITGLIADFAVDGPLGCWVAIHLSAYLTATLFRRRAQTDQTGFVRTVGDVAALVVSFFAARWIMGGFLGGMETTAILGGFLTTALLFLPVRPFFLLQRSEWVDA